MNTMKCWPLYNQIYSDSTETTLIPVCSHFTQMRQTVFYYYLRLLINMQWAPPGYQGEQESFNLRGRQQLFMGVSSCTGPKSERGATGCNAGWGGGVVGGTRWLQYLRSDVEVVPPMEHLVCEEYKHSAWVQPLLVTPKTGWIHW